MAQAIEKPCAKESLRECEKYLVRASKLIPMVTLSLTVTGDPQSGSAYAVEAVPHNIAIDIRTDFSVDHQYHATDNDPPYSLFGDNGSIPTRGRLGLGQHVITAKIIEQGQPSSHGYLATAEITITEATPPHEAALVDIVVESGLQPNIQTQLNQYATDLEDLLGYTTKIISVEKGDNPNEIRQIADATREMLRTDFNENNLTGVVIVGRVPVVYFAWDDRNVDNRFYAGQGQTGQRDVFPTYYYYSDLNGNWGDVDSYGNFTTLSGNNVKPDVWIGVIRTDSLHDTGKSESELMIDYFDRVYQYRREALNPPQRFFGTMLTNDPYFVGMEVTWRRQGRMLLPEGSGNVELSGYPSQATYLNYLADSSGYLIHWYKSALFNDVHNYNNNPNFPHCGEAPFVDLGANIGNNDERCLTISEVLTQQPKISFYAFFGGCSSGNFEIPSYWAGAHVFETPYGLASILSATNDGGGLWDQNWIDNYFNRLHNHERLGEAYRATLQEAGASDVGNVIIGDPTLSF